jgi:Leucine-rich repeat (LRR) protein
VRSTGNLGNKNLTRGQDANIQELTFFKSGMTRIDGLEKLKQLRSISFNLTAFITDYSFLKKAKTLEKLVITYGPDTSDWTFIEELSNLKILFIEGYRQKNIALDLTNLTSLEYLPIFGSDLESFPDIKNIPRSLKYLNLTSNKISSLPPDFGQYSHTTIFLKANPIENQGIKKRNIIFDWARNFLPEEYIIPY